MNPVIHLNPGQSAVLKCTIHKDNFANGCLLDLPRNFLGTFTISGVEHDSLIFI